MATLNYAKYAASWRVCFVQNEQQQQQKSQILLLCFVQMHMICDSENRIKTARCVIQLHIRCLLILPILAAQHFKNRQEEEEKKIHENVNKTFWNNKHFRQRVCLPTHTMRMAAQADDHVDICICLCNIAFVQHFSVASKREQRWRISCVSSWQPQANKQTFSLRILPIRELEL